MADLGDTSWSEVDNSNNAMPPNGWPEGMQPSDVNNSARADKGGVKRFWDRINVVKTTGGTSTAYTLAYDVAAASYYSGEKFSFIVNATCGSAPTLNINGLGAFNLRKFSGGAFVNLVAGDIVTNQPLEVYYNSVATTFDILVQQVAGVWQALGTSTPSGVGSVSFQSIPTSINTLQLIFDVTMGTNATTLNMQFYNSAGVLDGGGSSYIALQTTINTANGTGVSSANISFIQIGGVSSSSSSVGIVGSVLIPNIQGVKATQCNFSSNFLLSDGITGGYTTGMGYRVANGNITGVKIFPSAGVFSGRITLLATSN